MQLALAAGEGEAVLADLGVVAVGQLPDESIRLGGAGGGLDLLLAGVGAAVGDVRADGVGEEERIFRDQSDGGPQRVQGQLADVVAADQDGAVGDVVEARQEQGERVDLPEPEEPTTARVSPGRISKLRPSRTGRSWA